MKGSIEGRFIEIKMDFDTAALAALQKLAFADLHANDCSLCNRDWFQKRDLVKKFVNKSLN